MKMADQEWKYGAITAILLLTTIGLSAQELRIDPAPFGSDLQLYFPARTSSYYHVIEAGPKDFTSSNWHVADVIGGANGTRM